MRMRRRKLGRVASSRPPLPESRSRLALARALAKSRAPARGLGRRYLPAYTGAVAPWRAGLTLWARQVRRAPADKHEIRYELTDGDVVILRIVHAREAR